MCVCIWEIERVCGSFSFSIMCDFPYLWLKYTLLVYVPICGACLVARLFVPVYEWLIVWCFTTIWHFIVWINAKLKAAKLQSHVKWLRFTPLYNCISAFLLLPLLLLLLLSVISAVHQSKSISFHPALFSVLFLCARFCVGSFFCCCLLVKAFCCFQSDNLQQSRTGLRALFNFCSFVLNSSVSHYMCIFSVWLMRPSASRMLEYEIVNVARRFFLPFCI